MVGRGETILLVALKPNLRVLMMSAYPHETLLRQGRTPPDIQPLTKPFTRHALLTRIRAELEHQRDAVQSQPRSSIEAAWDTKAKTRATLLLVEDEEDTLSTLSDFFEQEGLRVVTAMTATRALELAREHGEAIDIVVTDVNLPDLPGPDLAAKLRHHSPASR